MATRSLRLWGTALCKQRNRRKILREPRNSPNSLPKESFKENNATNPRATKKHKVISSEFNLAISALHFPDSPKLIGISDGRRGMWSRVI